MKKEYKTPLHIRLRNQKYRMLKMRKKENRLKEKIYNQKYRQKNIDRIKLINKQYQKKFALEIRLKRKNLPIELSVIVRKHKGRCDICRKKGDGRWRSLNIDHCHKKKIFRGMLCYKCNKGLGLFKDNPVFLQRAIDYLLKSK